MRRSGRLLRHQSGCNDALADVREPFTDIILGIEEIRHGWSQVASLLKRHPDLFLQEPATARLALA